MITREPAASQEDIKRNAALIVPSQRDVIVDPPVRKTALPYTIVKLKWIEGTYYEHTKIGRRSFAL
ncbi:hypothetical protein [Nitrosomonas communis]|uniref:hypothetical protein n=1 Tax=Nitrosomonas communis TaxID=44574 RepID=UPI003D2D0898